jgi:pimeloyl-ACP methyl ester carboxylesterase
MLQYLPNSRQVIIQDCGHMSNMEKPDEFTRLILEQFKFAQ